MNRFALAAVLLVNAALLFPELKVRADLNDNVLHYTLIHGIKDAVETGQNPLDFWSPEIALGMPIARLYQPLSHMLVVGAWYATFKQVDLFTLFIVLRFAALALLPLTFYAFARLLRFTDRVGICAAILVPLVSGDAFGIDAGSFVWGGHGLFPQLVATHFLLLTLGTGWRSIREGRNWIVPGILLACTGWSNLLYGYVAGVSLLLIAAPAIAKRELRSLDRLAGIAGIGIAAAIPRLLVWFHDSRFMPATSPWHTGREFMYQSYGAITVLKNLVTGETFDHGRLPVLTLMVFAGILVIVHAKREYFPLLAFAVWLALYFGRPFWGGVLNLFGIVSSSMPLHRLIGPVQIFGVLIAAIGIIGVYDAIPSHRNGRKAALAGIVLMLIFPFQDRRSYLQQNADWIEQSAADYDRHAPDTEACMKLARENGGRAFAGMPGGWGSTFKIGAMPFYSLFPVHQIPSVGFLYLGFFPANDAVYLFNEQSEADYKLYDVRTVIAPRGRIVAPFLTLQAYQGDMVVYHATTRCPACGYTPGAGMFSIDNGVILSQHESAAAFQADGPADIDFRATFHPKWKARVDGNKVPIRAYGPGFLRVSVPAGAHVLQMQY